MSDRSAQRTVGALTVSVLVVAGLGLLYAVFPRGSQAPVAPVPSLQPEPPARPAPTPVPQPPSTGPMARRAVPPPLGTELPERPPDAPPAQMTPERYRDYNVAMNDVVVNSRNECLRPWVRDQELGEVEVVLDAVLWDGRVVDFGIRGLRDLPDHVVDCVADHAWSQPFPEHDLEGELRLQRAFPVDGR